nr:hypothetical protein [Tanacetum cinerariifolium]
EQVPLDKLNDLARKKRKHADDIHDLFRSTKKLKSSVQYGDHPETVLNEPILDQDYLHFSSCGGSKTKEDLSKSFSSTWLTTPS